MGNERVRTWTQERLEIARLLNSRPKVLKLGNLKSSKVTLPCIDSNVAVCWLGGICLSCLAYNLRWLLVVWNSSVRLLPLKMHKTGHFKGKFTFFLKRVNASRDPTDVVESPEPKRKLDHFSRFARLSSVTDWQSGRQTDSPRYSVGNNSLMGHMYVRSTAMRRNNA